MRIGQVVLRSSGGIGAHVADLAAAQRAAGDEVVVLTDAATAATFDFGETRIVSPDRPLPRSALGGVEIVHAHGFRAGWAGVLGGASRPGLPLALSLHNQIRGGPGPRRVAGELAARILMRRAAVVGGASSDLVAAARQLGADWAEMAPVPSPRVPALLSSPAEPLTSRAAGAARLPGADGLPAADDRPLILTIARIAPQKRLDVVVDAAACAAVSSRWVVLGDGPAAATEALRRRAADIGSPVEFRGATADVEPWLRAASVVLLTSEWEARALVVQEAMAAGTPVVASRAGGLVDLLDGIGDLTPVGAVDAVAEAVAATLTHTAQSQDRADRGRERATDWDDIEKVASTWRVRYDRALS